jgi:hypothetical protein
MYYPNVGFPVQDCTVSKKKTTISNKSSALKIALSTYLFLFNFGLQEYAFLEWYS